MQIFSSSLHEFFYILGYPESTPHIASPLSWGKNKIEFEVLQLQQNSSISHSMGTSRIFPYNNNFRSFHINLANPFSGAFSCMYVRCIPFVIKRSVIGAGRGCRG